MLTRPRYEVAHYHWSWTGFGDDFEDGYTTGCETDGLSTQENSQDLDCERSAQQLVIMFKADSSSDKAEAVHVMNRAARRAELKLRSASSTANRDAVFSKRAISQ